MPNMDWMNKTTKQRQQTAQSYEAWQGSNVWDWLGRVGTTMHWQRLLQCAAEEVRECSIGPLTCMLGPRRPLCWWCCRWANASVGAMHASHLGLVPPKLNEEQSQLLWLQPSRGFRARGPVEAQRNERNILENHLWQYSSWATGAEAGKMIYCAIRR